MDKKWNLQDVRPSSQPKKQRGAGDISSGRSVPNEYAKERRSQTVSGGGFFSKRNLMMGGIFVAVVVAVILIGILRTGADITIQPKYEDVTVQATFTAHSQPAAGELGYELLTLEADGERQVSATGQEEVSERTEGTITIYNKFSKNSLRLVTNTRFESPDALIFKITESAVVPGYTEDGSGKIVPGSITAEVYADQTGEAYNIGPSRFTVPGFEGEPEFDSVYAESSESFTGGFEGEKYMINDNELQSAQNALHEEIRTALRSRLETERPAGTVLYDNAVKFTFESLPSVDGGNGLAAIKERGVLRVPLFDGNKLATYIAESTVAEYEGEDITLANPDALTFSYASSTTATNDLSSVSELNFTLSGNVRLVWEFDEETLLTDLAGQSRSALPTVLAQYPAILQAEANIRPFWKRSFPDNVEKIHLETDVGIGGDE